MINEAWISKQDKGVLPPRFIFLETRHDNFSGYYLPPMKTEMLIDGKYYDLGRGLIAVVSCQNEERDQAAGTIAHEWRHHWQAFNWGPNQSPPSFNLSLPYAEAIKRFFRACRYERDALLFSHRHAPTELTAYWISLCKT